MSTIRKLLDSKGRNAWSIAPGASVFEAIKLMAEKHVGALVVLEDGKLVGIVSERDYARKVILEGKASKETLTQEIMTRRVLYVGQDKTIQECMALMTEKRIRHLPVLEGDHVEGVVSLGDLVKEIIAEQQFIIEQLESYINS
jgi:CBS domain-containing protein